LINVIMTWPFSLKTLTFDFLKFYMYFSLFLYITIYQSFISISRFSYFSESSFINIYF